jgi:hypothetical protein
MVNASNTLSRAATFNVAERFPTLRPITTLLYGTPSILTQRGNHHERGGLTTGGRHKQHDFLRRGGARNQIGSTNHAIMDDISPVGSLPELAIAAPTIIAELRKIGLEVNMLKSVSSVWCLLCVPFLPACVTQ